MEPLSLVLDSAIALDSVLFLVISPSSEQSVHTREHVVQVYKTPDSLNQWTRQKSHGGN